MRLEQSICLLNDLVDRIRDGSLAPAAFQRPYVWDAEDVEAMFTSILRGWPLGSFVIWEPSPDTDTSRISRGRLGPILASPERTGRTGLVLDGQNRLATIAWAIAQADGTTPPGDDLSLAERTTWVAGKVLSADLETRSVRFFDHAQSYSATRVPVGSLCGYSEVNAALRRADKLFGLSDDAWQWFGDEIPSRVGSARVQTTTLQDATTAEAREAFLHVCRVGKPIDMAHFDAAVGWKEGEDHDAGSPLRF